MCRSVGLSVCLSARFLLNRGCGIDTKRGYVGTCNWRLAQQESGAALSKNSMVTVGGLKLYTAIILGVH